MSKYQERLNEVYAPLVELSHAKEKLGSRFQRFSTEVDGPFLIRSPSEYENSKRRVIIVGQENNGWIGPYQNFLLGNNDEMIHASLEEYQKFELEKSHATTFFQTFAEIRYELNGESAARKSVLWSNLLKFNQGRDPQMIRSDHLNDALAVQGETFQREIEIFEPEIIIFLTGPYYDEIIDRFYPGLKSHQFGNHSMNTVARLDHKDLPDNTYRTYHPNYLRIQPSRTSHCLPTIFDSIQAYN